MESMREIKCIGMVGLGYVGGALAAHLSRAGFELFLIDTDPNAVKRLVDSGLGKAARNLTQLGETCDVVITILPSGKAVRQVLIGEPEGEGDCVAAGLRPGTTVIDISAIAPDDTLHIEKALEKKKVGMLDAPVSGLRGGPRDAEDGSLTVMIGGDEALIDHCMPIFKQIGHTVFRTGGLGTAHAAKAMSNAVFATAMLSSIEALLIAKRYGIPPKVMIEVLNASFGYNAATNVTLPEHVLSGTYAAGFKIAYMVKDLTSALKIAAEGGISPPLISQVSEHWRSAMEEIGADTDHTHLAELWATRLGDSFNS